MLQEILKGSAKIFSATVIAKCIRQVNSIIVARWLGAELFGQYSFFFVLLGNIGAVGELGLGGATVYFHNRKQMPPGVLLPNVLVFGLVLSALLLTAMTALTAFGADHVFWSSGRGYLWTLALLVAPYMWFGVLSAYFRARKEFTIYSLGIILAPAIALVVLIIFLIGFRGGVPAAIAAQAGGSIVALLALSSLATWNTAHQYRVVLPVLRKMLVYGTKGLSLRVVMMLMKSFPFYLLAFYGLQSAIGQMAVAVSLISILGILSSSLSLALTPYITTVPESDIWKMTINTIHLVTPALTVIGLLVAIFASWIVGLLYGEQYGGAVLVLRLLAITLILESICNLLSRPFISGNAVQFRVPTIAFAVGLVVGIAASYILYLTSSFELLVSCTLGALVGYVSIFLLLLLGFSRFSGMSCLDVIKLDLSHTRNALLSMRSRAKVDSP